MSFIRKNQDQRTVFLKSKMDCDLDKIINLIIS